MVLKPNSVAPNFTVDAVVDGEIKKISLSDYKGKYVVLFFYPFDFTFVCPTEICAFSDRAEEFKKLGCEVIGGSCDSVFSHLNWIAQSRKEGGIGQMNIPLIADTTKKVATDYEVLSQEGDCPYRGLFLIDREQKIRAMMINDNPIGRSVDEALRLLQALQFTEEHGEVCPANWQKGQATIKPSLKESKEFFASQ
ncbi:Peroxiredoxin-2 [Mycoemilia scoparia]|uniref:thioredoxin-dependent peroxiredoxin n=1 Tax=Mycoemilia scoparia TaxID=417184 RepID=A0A9W8A6I3_9FUNG|nr:Peroxiredoxin-2 [Mycoemilia scoparia]